MHTPATSVEGKPIVCHQKGFNSSRPRLRQPESRAHGQADHRSVCKGTLWYLSFTVWNMEILLGSV